MNEHGFPDFVLSKMPQQRPLYNLRNSPPTFLCVHFREKQGLEEKRRLKVKLEQIQETDRFHNNDTMYIKTQLAAKSQNTTHNINDYTVPVIVGAVTSVQTPHSCKSKSFTLSTLTGTSNYFYVCFNYRSNFFSNF